jgi:hypothetical protein
MIFSKLSVLKGGGGDSRSPRKAGIFLPNFTATPFEESITYVATTLRTSNPTKKQNIIFMLSMS